jgi:predicted transcriptional regulator YheO
VVAGVRLPPLSDSLDILISRIETELGAPLNELDRVGKQVALRRLDEQGAFLLRRSIESVADTMDVSRITIYNYLNAIREE